MAQKIDKKNMAIATLTSFTSFSCPCEAAIDAFFAITTYGQAVYQVIEKLSFREKLDLSELLAAHEIISHPNWSGILEQLWVNGVEDTPLPMLLLDFMHDYLQNTPKQLNEWLRKLPVFERAYKLSKLMHMKIYIPPAVNLCRYEIISFPFPHKEVFGVSSTCGVIVIVEAADEKEAENIGAQKIQKLYPEYKINEVARIIKL